MVKAQVHSGGRGKAGGVIVCDAPRDVFLAASSLIGGRLVTGQSGENGLYVPAVLLAEKLNIEREIYLALAVDTAALAYTVIASPCGGMEIEETAKSAPEQIIRLQVKSRVMPYHTQYLADRLRLTDAQKARLGETLSSSLEHCCLTPLTKWHRSERIIYFSTGTTMVSVAVKGVLGIDSLDIVA